jgi:asparagine N-glycosylation enzyme membrane subunit Stt3
MLLSFVVVCWWAISLCAVYMPELYATVNRLQTDRAQII